MYFDLHLHPGTKPFLTGPALGEKRHNCWDELDAFLDLIRSQSCLKQLADGKVNVSVACLYALETPFTYNFFVEHILPAVTFARATAMQFDTNDEPYKRLLAELKLLKEADGQGPKRVQYIRSYQDINPDYINLVLAVEGAHCFGGENDLLENFEAFKTSGNRLLYLTLTHLTRAFCASHAYSIKLIKKHHQFKPKGGGLYDMGKKVIDLAYNESIGGHQVFIDVKHMGLLARQQFYNYRREKGYQDIPIIASHTACTGISWHKIRKHINEFYSKTYRDYPNEKFVAAFYNNVPGLSGTKFNPISINLYDEDIAEIVQSKGLIGLILEKKSIGLQSRASEYFEFSEFEQAIKARGLEYVEDPNKDFEEDLTPEADDKYERIADARLRPDYLWHLEHLANQILHIVKVGGAAAWNHICIGSDFDGLISAVHCCEDASEFEIVATDLPAVVLKMAKENPTETNYHITNISAQIGKIFYGNAMGFLAKHWGTPTPPDDPIVPVA